MEESTYSNPLYQQLNNDEISFNLNSPQKEKEHLVQELTLDDLSDAAPIPSSSHPSSSSSSNQPPRINIPKPPKNTTTEVQTNTARTVEFLDTATFDNSDVEEIQSTAARNKWYSRIGAQYRNGGQSEESDFDLSDTKLRRLGVVNTLRKEHEEFSNLLNSYSKQFGETHSDSTRFSDQKQQSSQQIQQQQYNQQQQQQQKPQSSMQQTTYSKDILGKYGHMLFFKDSPYKETNILSNSTQDRSSISQSNQRTQPDINYNNNNNPSSLNQTNFQANSSSNYPNNPPYNSSLPHFQSYQQQQPPLESELGSSEKYNDPYIISLNSFKNSLYSGQKENISSISNRPPFQRYQYDNNNITENNSNNTSKYLAGTNPHKNSVLIMNGSVVSAGGVDSSEIARSALSMHHLAASGYDPKPKEIVNHPVLNLGRIYGECGTLEQEVKKRSLSSIGENQTKDNNGSSSSSSFQTPFQKFLEAQNKFQDVFLPEKDKMMNNPLKLLKHKIMIRDQQTLANCKQTLSQIEQEINNNIDIQVEKDNLPPTSLAASSLAFTSRINIKSSLTNS